MRSFVFIHIPASVLKNNIFSIMEPANVTSCLNLWWVIFHNGWGLRGFMGNMDTVILSQGTNSPSTIPDN